MEPCQTPNCKGYCGTVLQIERGECRRCQRNRKARDWKRRNRQRHYAAVVAWMRLNSDKVRGYGRTSRLRAGLARGINEAIDSLAASHASSV
jgi:hypothetical protein